MLKKKSSQELKLIWAVRNKFAIKLKSLLGHGACPNHQLYTGVRSAVEVIIKDPDTLNAHPSHFLLTELPQLRPAYHNSSLLFVKKTWL